MLRVKEVAERLNVSEDTVRTYIKLGQLQAVRLGDGKRPTIRVTENALVAFLERGK